MFNIGYFKFFIWLFFIYVDENNKNEIQMSSQSDAELQSAVDPLLISLDTNYDGFIEYSEYKNRMFWFFYILFLYIYIYFLYSKNYIVF